MRRSPSRSLWRWPCAPAGRGRLAPSRCGRWRNRPGGMGEASLNSGVHLLETAGFRVRVGAAVLKKSGYLAGTDRERIADMRAMFADPDIKAIIAARGGYGSGRLLPLIDPAVARQHP